MGFRRRGDGGAGLIRSARNAAITSLTKGRDQGYKFLDEAEAKGLEDINPLLPSARGITQSAFNKVADFDGEIAKRVKEADAAYLAPSQRFVDETLKNLFRSGGVGGSNNSKFQNYMARSSQEMALNEAMRRYLLENQVKRDFLDEQSRLFNFGNQPIAAKAGTVLDLGQARANTAIGVGNQLANVHMNSGQSLANIAQQQQARRASKGSSLLGAGAGLLGNVVGMFTGIR